MTSRLLVLGMLICVGFGCDSPSQQPDNPPNFIIIFCDDLGYGDLGCFGNELIRTPHLDQMAADGMKLTSLYSVSPVCSPSRAGLMTGRYPIRMGIHHVFFPESWTGMAPEEVTIAEYLQQQGYTNGCFGKWHLGHHRQYLPLQQGFDEYFGIPYSNDMEAVVYLEGNEVVSHEVDQKQTTKTYTERAVDFIDRHQSEPFFLYVPHSMPHVPLYASESFDGNSKRGLYGDVIEEIDWSVGQILEKLEETGIVENTMVVFTSDNGPWLVFGPDGGSAGPLREGKQFTFEGGMRVPGIVQWKGTIEAGSESNELVTMMDWLPTMKTLAGDTSALEQVVDGQDISLLLLEQELLGERELAYYYSGELRAYRVGNWKLKLPYPGNDPAPWRSGVAAHDTLLIDLTYDIGERLNLLNDHPEKKAEILTRMKAFEQHLGPIPPALKVRQGADNSHYDRQVKWREE